MLKQKPGYRFKANATLAGVFLLFLGSLVMRQRYPHVLFLQLLNFTLEAALVGGIADWFAVTALFSRPLGWPFHTALIPQNRDKVIDGIGHMVEDNLLSSELIETNIGLFHPTRRWVAATPPETLRHTANTFSARLRTYFCQLEPEVMAGFLAKRLRNYLTKTSFVPHFTALLQAIPNQPNNIVDFVLSQLILKVSAPNTMEGIRRYLNTQKEARLAHSPLNRTLFRLFESVDAVNLDEAADALQEHLRTNLKSLYDPSHPLRQVFDSSIQTLINSLASNSYNSLEQWKNEVLLSYPWEEPLTQIITTMQKELAEDETPLSRWFTGQSENLLKQVSTNSVLQQTLDDYLQMSLLRLARANHHWVGQTARATLETFSNTDLNTFIQEKAGNDLQWIRINGSLVGGLIGLTLFLFLHVIAKL